MRKLAGRKKEREERRMSTPVKAAIISGVLLLVLVIRGLMQPGWGELEAWGNVSGTALAPESAEKVSAIMPTNCTKQLFAGGQRDSFTVRMAFGDIITTATSKLAAAENVNGTTYTVRETISQVSGEVGGRQISSTSKVKTYISDEWRCAFQTMEITMENQTARQDVECPDKEANFSIFRMCADMLVLAGKGRITTAAGTFDTDKYLTPDGTISIWMTDAVPAPIKIEMNTDPKMTMTLEGYMKS